MPPALLVALLALAFATLALQFLIWRAVHEAKPPSLDLSPIERRLDDVRAIEDRGNADIRDEFSRLRQEQASANRDLHGTLEARADSLRADLREQMGEHEARIERLRQTLDERLQMFGGAIDANANLLRVGIDESGARLQAQVSQALDRLQSTLAQSTQQSREEVGAALRVTAGAVDNRLGELVTRQDSKLDQIRQVVELKLTALSQDNERRLEQMRNTVDEKLQATLEARLGASFNLVSERLEKVRERLGELQSLQSGVGDLNRVLTNVKKRGVWGEVQLSNLLEHVLAPTQYARNVDTTGTQERVDFAIKLPGHEEGGVCWLPIDAKFPVEDYLRLVDAADKCDIDGVEAAGKKFEGTLGTYAKSISDKYLRPPLTTDFGILFLPTEGLYAEALRRPGIVERMQVDHRIVIAGPTTFAAILNSLQMGFHTLAIQQKSSDVWKLLAAVKSEFTKYGVVISQVKKKLEQATKAVDTVEVRTRVLGRELRAVESATADTDDHGPNLFDLAMATDDEEVVFPEAHA